MGHVNFEYVSPIHMGPTTGTAPITKIVDPSHPFLPTSMFVGVGGGGCCMAEDKNSEMYICYV